MVCAFLEIFTRKCLWTYQAGITRLLIDRMWKLTKISIKSSLKFFKYNILN